MLERGGARSPSARRFAVSFGAMFACLLLWGLSTPMFGSPDEQEHAVYAYALVHGDRGHPTAEGPEFRVPAPYIDEHILCYAFDMEKPASCLELTSEGPDHNAVSTAATYPPFYYYLVGWPSLFSSRLFTLYAMRAVSAMWVALLFAVALENVARVRNRTSLIAGVALATTPAFLFFGASINPSGLSIAAGLALWTAGLTLALGARVAELNRAVARVGAPLCLLLLLRRDALLWSALILLVLVGVTPRNRLRVLVRARAVWLWSVAAIASAAAQVTMSGAETATSLADNATGSASGALADLPFYIQQMGGGVLGWLDTPLPQFVYTVFTYGTVAMGLVALRFAPRRVALAILAVAALVVGAPLIIGTYRYPYFQGRYMLPFTIGLALLAGAGLSDRLGARRSSYRVTVGALVLTGIAHVVAFAHTMRRFTAGAHGPWWFSVPPAWEPPALSPSALLVLFTLAVTAWVVWMALLATPDRRRRAAPSPGEQRSFEARHAVRD
jgi:hypothetical protein